MKHRCTKPMAVATALLLASSAGFADNGYVALFKPASGAISTTEQKAMYTRVGLSSGKARGTFVLAGCPETDFAIELKDLNGDGTPEVFLVGGNTCTSGVTGSSVWMFAKSPSGHYRMNFGFPAAGFALVPGETSHGFPHIRFTGAGLCDSIWRWSGRQYVHFKNIPTAPDGCSGR